jgi:hypothetical protein
MSRFSRLAVSGIFGFALALAATGCPRSFARQGDPRDLALAIAASESVTVALADSLAPLGGFASAVDDNAPPLSACDDHVDATGWETFSSDVVELRLPPGFSSGQQIGQRAEWRAPNAWIRATQTSSLHSGWSGTITSECDVWVSGYPTHIDVINTGYGKGVHATIQVQGGTYIGIEGAAKATLRQAQLLHAIRYARVSASWAR